MGAAAAAAPLDSLNSIVPATVSGAHPSADSSKAAVNVKSSAKATTAMKSAPSVSGKAGGFLKKALPAVAEDDYEESDLSSEEEEEKKRELTVEDVEEDDYVKPISIDTYVEFRIRPLLEYLERQIPRLSRRAGYVKVITLVLSTLGTLLAGVSQQIWVALTVALGTAVANAAQLSSTTAAQRDVKNTLVWLDSLSTVQRRTRAVRTRALNVVESAMFNIATAYTGTATRPTEGSEGKEDLDEKKKA